MEGAILKNFWVIAAELIYSYPNFSFGVSMLPPGQLEEARFSRHYVEQDEVSLTPAKSSASGVGRSSVIW